MKGEKKMKQMFVFLFINVTVEKKYEFAFALLYSLCLVHFRWRQYEFVIIAFPLWEVYE